MPTTMLELEFSEDTIMSDPSRAREVLSRLDAMGIWLAVDDFGTGRSTLPYLKQLPVTSLKVDRPFVASMCDDEQHAQVIRSTIALGRNLGLRVVAEGVETQEVLDELRLLGCDLAQGFLLSRPLPADEVGEWIEERERAQAAA